MGSVKWTFRDLYYKTFIFILYLNELVELITAVKSLMVQAPCADCQILSSMTRAYPSGHSTAPGLTHKYLTSPNEVVVNEHSSLFYPKFSD